MIVVWQVLCDADMIDNTVIAKKKDFGGNW